MSGSKGGSDYKRKIGSVTLRRGRDYITLADGHTYLNVAGLIRLDPKHPLLDVIVWHAATNIRVVMRNEEPEALVARL